MGEKTTGDDLVQAMTGIAVALSNQSTAWSDLRNTIDVAAARGFTRMDTTDLRKLANQQLKEILAALDAALPFFDQLHVEELTRPAPATGDAENG